MTNSWVDEYLQWLTIEKGRARTTVAAYRRDLTALESWVAAEELDLLRLRESDLERYFNTRRRAQNASSSVARAIAATRGFFSFLLDEGHLVSDPASKLRGGRRGRTLPKPLAEGDVVSMLDAISGTDPLDRRDRAVLELLYGTGSRVSEATALDLSDLDFDEELIRVTGKGSKQRLVPMGTALKAALISYLSAGGRGSIEGARASTRLFLNARGGSLSRQGVALIVQKRALNAGVERSRVSAHVFRHSCATHMLDHGADIRVVQELLGHSSIATTQIYTAVSATTLRREYDDAHPRAHD